MVGGGLANTWLVRKSSQGDTVVIEYSELVTGVYGYWPDFAGANVLSVLIEPHSTLFYELGDRTLTLQLHWWLGAPAHYDGGPIVYADQDLHRRIHIAFAIDELHLHTFHCSSTGIDNRPVMIVYFTISASIW